SNTGDSPDELEALIQSHASTATTTSDADAAGASPSLTASAASLNAPSISTAEGGIYLQYGAFSASQTAHQLALRLNEDIAAVEHRQAEVMEANALYRVQIGP